MSASDEARSAVSAAFRAFVARVFLDLMRLLAAGMARGWPGIADEICAS
jgi:hypothetical protein